MTPPTPRQVPASALPPAPTGAQDVVEGVVGDVDVAAVANLEARARLSAASVELWRLMKVPPHHRRRLAPRRRAPKHASRRWTKLRAPFGG